MRPVGTERDLEPGGMVFAGGPNEIADRMLHLHDPLGHRRQILQMDVGGMSHATYLRAIELLGTAVLPQIRKQLGCPSAHHPLTQTGERSSCSSRSSSAPSPSP